jgi:hypothetical protein
VKATATAKCLVHVLNSNADPTGSLKKGVGAAIIVSVGNAGGCISSFLYPSTQAPRYFQGHGVNVAYCFMTICLAGFMTFYLEHQNKKKAELRESRTWTAEERSEISERQADGSPFFVYTL